MIPNNPNSPPPSRKIVVGSAQLSTSRSGGTGPRLGRRWNNHIPFRSLLANRDVELQNRQKVDVESTLSLPRCALTDSDWASYQCDRQAPEWVGSQTVINPDCSTPFVGIYSRIKPLDITYEFHIVGIPQD